MDAPSPMLWLGMGLIAGLVSFALLWLLGRLTAQPLRNAVATPLNGGEASYLFQDDLMFDQGDSEKAGFLPTRD